MLVRVAAASSIIAFLGVFVAVCSADHDPVCSDITNGRSCSFDSNAQSVAVLDDRVLVGATNHLFSFGRDLSFQESISINPQPDKLTRCTTFGREGLSLPEAECRNFIKVIQQVPSGYETNSVDQRQIMVCGTNAYFPKCTIRDSSSLSNYSFMTSNTTEDQGYSPHAGSDPIVGILASNGRFFSATHFQAFQRRRTIAMARRPLSGDSQFRVMAPTSDPLWFNKPEFISTYEIGDHIYFFMREPAYEVDNGESIVYSRAVRICKTDEGQTASSTNTPFLTYQKARIRCSFDGDRGSIPYNYDNLESTFLWNGSTQALTLYAIFSSPNNGPEGSAICKFSFDQTKEGSLTKVFEDGTYVVPDTQEGQQVWIAEGPGPFSCPGTTGTQRTVDQANRYQLVDGVVEGVDPEPLYVVSGVRMDKIAVDVITYNNSVQEVVYFTTDNGEIRQVVHVTGSQSGSQDHVIQSVNSAVHFLSVHKNQDETRQVYATTEDRIVTISRGNCTRYEGCFKCLDSSDAYCGWSPSASMCYNKLSQSRSDLIEAHSASEATIVMVCGSRPYVPQEPSELPTSTCPYGKPTNDAPTTGGKICPPLTQGLSNGNKDSSRSEMNIPTIVGASVGAFVLGVPVGAFACFIFFRLFVRPRQSKNYLEEERDSITQPHANGGSRMSNIPPTNESIDTSGHNPEKKIDLSVSVDSSPLPSSRVQRGLPRYVDVQTKSQLSCSAPSGGGNGFTSSSMEMMYKHNSVDVTGILTSKRDSAFTGSENDIVPPMVHLTGNDGFGTPYKKHAKQTRFNMPPTGTNGVSRTQVPGYKVPKGRTPSTTWLRETSSISECSDLSSPLQSPISDV